jgi:hypothetical protein
MIVSITSSGERMTPAQHRGGDREREQAYHDDDEPEDCRVAASRISIRYLRVLEDHAR